MASNNGIPPIKPRRNDSHKGTHGRALLIGGSRGMTGAIVLAGTAASRAGAGLVTMAVPDRCLETVAAFEASYMTTPVPDDDQGRVAKEAVPILLSLAKKMTSIGIGPGMARSDGVTHVVTELYQHYSGPMVLDADALNALSSTCDGLPKAAGPRVFTPHLGEFRRLIDENSAPEAAREHAVEFAARNEVIVVLKGPHSLVTDGDTKFENNTGNPGMATGGAGDVLTGVLTALLGQDYSPLEAAILGVHVHGLAGDLARDTYGEVSLLAENIRDALPTAFKKLSRRS